MHDNTKMLQGRIKMWKNYFLAFFNIAISGLPLLLAFGFSVYLSYWLLLIIFLLCTSWNLSGDMIIISFVLKANRIHTSEAVMQFLQERFTPHTVANFYCISNTIPFYFFINKKKIIISSALIQNLKISKEMSLYIEDTKYIISRKILLLSLFGYTIASWIARVLTMLVALGVRICLAVVMFLATGGLWNSKKAMKAISFGVLIGGMIVKINDFYNCISDKIIDWLLKKTLEGSLLVVELDNATISECSKK